jgi:hypothetical protein
VAGVPGLCSQVLKNHLQSRAFLDEDLRTLIERTAVSIAAEEESGLSQALEVASVLGLAESASLVALCWGVTAYFAPSTVAVLDAVAPLIPA